MRRTHRGHGVGPRPDGLFRAVAPAATVSEHRTRSTSSARSRGPTPAPTSAPTDLLDTYVTERHAVADGCVYDNTCAAIRCCVDDSGDQYRLSLSFCDTEIETEPSAADQWEHRDLLAGFVRMHILHHAAREEIYGLWMIEELATHGYRLSPGTLYPMLHKMVRDGYLTVRSERVGRSTRKLYSTTQKGREGLALARDRVRIFVRGKEV